MRCFTSTCFILVQVIKYVYMQLLVYDMLVNVNGIYYVHAFEQAR